MSWSPFKDTVKCPNPKCRKPNWASNEQCEDCGCDLDADEEEDD